MNGARLVLSLLLVAMPAVALAVVRRTRRPRAWAIVISASLGAGFVLLVASLIHAALPLVFTLLGRHSLAEACRAMGGHLFGDPAPFSAIAGVLALVIVVRAWRGASATLQANTELRRGAALKTAQRVAGNLAVLLPLRHTWAIAIPGGSPGIVVSPALVGALERQELEAVIEHERAHLEHHHVRFLLLGTAVSCGLWFLPWSRRANTALRLSLERWADELASADSRETRAYVQSAVRKLASLAPSALASYRIKALDSSGEANGRDWIWPTVASATVPLALGLTITLVIHLSRLFAIVGAG